MRFLPVSGAWVSPKAVATPPPAVRRRRSPFALWGSAFLVHVVLTAALSRAHAEAQSIDCGVDLQGAGGGEPLTAVAPSRSSSYFGTMMLADTAVIGVTSVLVVWSEGGGSQSSAGIAALGFLAFVGTGAVVHYTHGNQRQVWQSVGRRVLLPLGTALGVGLVAHANECSGEDCGLETVGWSALGAGVGMLVAMVWDWSVAHVEPSLAGAVEPFATSDGERLVFGLAGRF